MLPLKNQLMKLLKNSAMSSDKNRGNVKVVLNISMPG
jgi:hypothetical protein